MQSNGTSTAELIGNDIFFEITDPLELEYTYRLRPAKDFGAPFVRYSLIKNWFYYKWSSSILMEFSQNLVFNTC